VIECIWICYDISKIVVDLNVTVLEFWFNMTTNIIVNVMMSFMYMKLLDLLGKDNYQ
jgi:hypothetical protein